MNLPIKLSRNFTEQYNKLQEKYGNEIAKLNGFAPGQLSYTDFISNFQDNNVIADASIDSSSNVTNKDIVALLNEMSKPHSKLLSFHKLFYEIQKLYDYKTACQWLEAEWDGHLYMHDAPSASFKSYCYSGNEKVWIKENEQTLFCSLRDLYDFLPRDYEEYDESLNQLVKRPKDIYIADLNDENDIVWASLLRVLRHENSKPMRLITLSNNLQQLVTEDHPVITEKGDFPAKDVKIGTKIRTEYGEATLIDNIEYAEECPIVYDVTTSTGHFICNGILSHNCFAYDLKDLAEKGLYFIKNFNAEPAKHLTTFVDFVKEFVSYFCVRTSGAVGLPNLIPYLYYFWKKDKEEGYYIKDPDTYARQNIQRLIYSLNQPFLREQIQSAFTNTSVFDREYLTALFGAAKFPDGTDMIDDIEEIMDFQKMFMEVMSNIRSHNMFTFPVSTISLIRKNGKFLDEEFAEWAIKHNMKWCDSNFFIDDSVTSLSNCPLSPDTQILAFNKEQNQFTSDTIENLYKEDKQIITLSNGKPLHCKINKFDLIPNYKITLINGMEITTTKNHLNKVYGKNYLETKDLTVEDYLPISRAIIKGDPNNLNSLTYEEGKIVGAFLGDGSYDSKSKSAFILSLNRETDRAFMDWLHDYVKIFNGACGEYLCHPSTVGKKHEQHCVNFRITCPYLRNLIERFVLGDRALNKAINLSVLNYSIPFRQGIIDGWYQTDGGNNNRIYSSSKKLITSMITVFNSLGIATRVNIDNREGRLSSAPCYTIRWYNPGNRKKLEDVYIVDDNYIWFKIKSIEQIHTNYNYSFCLEVLEKDKEPIFTLANGIVTHNCRLRNDISDLYFNSIGGTALKVGSVKVSTINLARLALESDTEKEYLIKLKDLIELDMKALHAQRHIIKRNVEKGLMPHFDCGAIDFEHLYSTIGFIGIYETMKSFGYTREDEFGNVFYTKEADEFGKKIFEILHQAKNLFMLDKDYKINCEQIPGESAADKLMQKDKIFFPETVIDDLPLYGNQFIPLGIKTTMVERIRIATLFDSYCNGG